MAMEAPPTTLQSKALPDVAITDTVIPDSYRWPTHELNHVAHDEFSHDEIAVIDLQQEPQEVRARIREACANWGFFQVVNHGVDPELLKRAQAVSTRFFELPMETKEQLECTMEGDRMLGYGFPGGSNKARTSRRVWSEGLFLDSRHAAGYAAVLWRGDEEEQEVFRTTMEEYLEAMRELGVRLFRLIVESLFGGKLQSLGVRIDDERFVPKEPALMRLNHYPPCPHPALTTGLMPHHDANLFTILHQGAVGGLQVLKGEHWVAVRPLPHALAINAGNMLQVISNDMCTSALHKAVVNKNEDRYSLAYFVQAPDWDQIAPLPELLDQDHRAKYRPFTWPEYLTNQLKNVANALEHFAVVQ